MNSLQYNDEKPQSLTPCSKCVPDKLSNFGRDAERMLQQIGKLVTYTGCAIHCGGASLVVLAIRSIYMVKRPISQSEKDISRHRPLDEFTVIPLQQVRLLIPSSQYELFEGIKSGIHLQPIRVGKRKRGWLLADVQMLVGAPAH